MQSSTSKGKAVPLQARSGPEGSGKLRFPDFVITALDGGRLSALRTCRPYPQEMLLVLISVRGIVDPIVDRKDFMSKKNPLRPAGIEPATFRFVAQHLNHCATAVSAVHSSTRIKFCVPQSFRVCMFSVPTWVRCERDWKSQIIGNVIQKSWFWWHER